MRQVIIICVCLLTISACQSLAAENVPATLHTEMTAYATEAVGLRSSVQLERTVISATVQAAETQAAGYYNYNDLLLATVRANQAPTPGLQVAVVEQGSAGAMSEESMSGETMTNESMSGEMSDANAAAGEMNFTQIGMTSAIRQSDRCPEGQASSFNANSVSSLFLTTVAFNLESGTRISVNWAYQDNIVFQHSWTATNFASQICIAMEFTPTNERFAAGAWSATLLVNGTPIETTQFSIQDS